MKNILYIIVAVLAVLAVSVLELICEFVSENKVVTFIGAVLILVTGIFVIPHVIENWDRPEALYDNAASGYIQKLKESDNSENREHAEWYLQTYGDND